MASIGLANESRAHFMVRRDIGKERLLMRSSPVFDESLKPIFIIGAPRSGTSILTWVVGQHPNIQVMPETNWIATMAVGGYLSHGIGSSREKFTHLSSSEYPLQPFMRRLGEFVNVVVNDCFEERCRKFYGNFRDSDEIQLREGSSPAFALLKTPTEPKRRWIDGTPLNTQFLWAIAEMFPAAVFIHNLRRPDEVATSLEGFDKLGVQARPLEEGLSSWFQHVENAALLEQALGFRRVFRLRFERISEDPEALLRELFHFLGEQYCPDCLLPLGQRLNSSEVSDRRNENLARMFEMPEYLKASSLYWNLLNVLPSEYGDTEALKVLRARFSEHCSERSLL